jgi:hypothetical protein
MGPDHPMFAGPRGGGHPGVGGGYGIGGGGRGGMGMRGGHGRGVRYDPVHPFGRGECVMLVFFIRKNLFDITDLS